jgi:NAD(P)-dependent dehydrogenase (short-subunit alcohol dehydrogenase family)
MAIGSQDDLPPVIMESHAFQRFAGVDEVAAVIVFLAGSDASFITGSVIGVNGGCTA